MSSFIFFFFGWLFASQKTGFSGFRYRFIPSLPIETGYASHYNPCHCLKLKNSKLNLQIKFYLHIITSAKLSPDSSLTFTGKDKKKKFSLSDLTLIEGGEKGVDALAKDWAVSNGVPVETYKADWARYGRGAGHRRNTEMVFNFGGYSRPD